MDENRPIIPVVNSKVKSGTLPVHIDGYLMSAHIDDLEALQNIADYIERLWWKYWTFNNNTPYEGTEAKQQIDKMFFTAKWVYGYAEYKGAANE